MAPLPVIGCHLLHFCSIPIHLMMGLVSIYCNSILAAALIHCLFVFSKSDPQHSLRFSNIHRSSCISYIGLHMQLLSFSHLSHVSWVSLASAWVSLPNWRLHVHQVKCTPFQVSHSIHGCKECRVSLLVPVWAQVWRMEWVEMGVSFSPALLCSLLKVLHVHVGYNWGQRWAHGCTIRLLVELSLTVHRSITILAQWDGLKECWSSLVGFHPCPALFPPLWELHPL